MKAIISMVLLAGGALAMPVQAQSQSQNSQFGGVKLGVVGGYDHPRLEYGDFYEDKGGFLYGVTLGYDMDFGPAVIGAEVEWTDSTTKGRGYDEFNGLTGTLKSGRDLYAGIRVGVPVTPNVLLYGKIGYSNAGAIASLTDGATTVKWSDTLEGVRVGGGVEVVHDALFGRIEYRYTDYGRYVAQGIDTDASVSRQQVTVTGGVERRRLSVATTVKAARVPLAWAAGVQTRLSPEARVVRPGEMETPDLVRVPEETASMRKLGVVPSESDSLAEAARVA